MAALAGMVELAGGKTVICLATGGTLGRVAVDANGFAIPKTVGCTVTPYCVNGLKSLMVVWVLVGAGAGVAAAAADKESVGMVGLGATAIVVNCVVSSAIASLPADVYTGDVGE